MAFFYPLVHLGVHFPLLIQLYPHVVKSNTKHYPIVILMLVEIETLQRYNKSTLSGRLVFVGRLHVWLNPKNAELLFV